MAFAFAFDLRLRSSDLTHAREMKTKRLSSLVSLLALVVLVLALTGTTTTTTRTQSEQAQKTRLCQGERTWSWPSASSLRLSPFTLASAAETETETETEAKGETFTFQAEVSRLLDIIINSLYSNKDIFLRELISNASDALDKIRLLSLKKVSSLDTGKDLEVRITFDKEKKVLSIRDTGIGMTKDDLMSNLGTIAKSGTSAFIDTVAKGGDMNLIGQFGVGFYSAFLAADKVQVVSKHNDDPKQHVWESTADGNFAIYEDADAEGDAKLDRGTQINLFIKEEAEEYLDQNVLGKLVSQYSQFINYPIYLLEEEEKEIEVEAEEEDDEDEDDDELDLGDDEEEDEDEGADVEETLEKSGKQRMTMDLDDGPKMVKKTIKEDVWKRKNSAKAVWLRTPSEVEQDEYDEFFKVIAKGHYQGVDPSAMAKTHFKAEGDVEFRSILFIPDSKPGDLAQGPGSAHSVKSKIKLYVRRVFISDSFDDLLPNYLSFIFGIVDSDTLPLNVNRESLQHHGSLKTIKKKLIRKALDMMKKLADEDKPSNKDEEDEEESEGEEKRTDVKDLKYPKFYKEYGSFLKMGVIEDQPNRIRLSKLLRFKTSHDDYSGDDGEMTDFDSYVKRMKEGQKKIFYLIGSSLEEVKSSPFVEKLVSEGYEVIYFTEPLDEYLMQHLVEYNDIKFQNAAKEDLTLEDSQDAKKKQKQLRAHFKPFTKWWKGLMPADIDTVKISNRLTTSPCVVVSSKYGYTANMERIVKAQTMADPNQVRMYLGKKVLEVNPFHPSIKKLKEMFENDAESETAKDMAALMYATSLLESGFELADPRAYAKRVYDVLNEKFGIDGDVVDDFEYKEEEEEEEKSHYIHEQFEDDMPSPGENVQFVDKLPSEVLAEQEESKEEL